MVRVYDAVINRLSHRTKIDHMKADDPRVLGNPFIKTTSQSKVNFKQNCDTPIKFCLPYIITFLGDKFIKSRRQIKSATLHDVSPPVGS